MPYCSAAWHSAWTSRGSRAQADHRPDEAVARGGDMTAQLGSQSQPDADLHSSRDGLAVTVAAVPEQRPRETTGLEASGALCTALACPKAHGTGGQMAHDPAGGIDDGHLHVHRGRDGEGDADVPALGHGLRALGEAGPRRCNGRQRRYRSQRRGPTKAPPDGRAWRYPGLIDSLPLSVHLCLHTYAAVAPAAKPPPATCKSRQPLGPPAAMTCRDGPADKESPVTRVGATCRLRQFRRSEGPAREAKVSAAPAALDRRQVAAEAVRNPHTTLSTTMSPTPPDPAAG